MIVNRIADVAVLAIASALCLRPCRSPVPLRLNSIRVEVRAKEKGPAGPNSIRVEVREPELSLKLFKLQTKF